MSHPLVSIILPCYKEEKHLLESVQELLKVARGYNFTYEFIFVEDGSPDKTAAELKKLEPSLSNSKFIYHERNKGRGAAIKSGYKAASGDIIGYIDIDLEVSPLYISDLVDALKLTDVAIGKREYFYKFTFQAVLRNILSLGYRRLSKFILHHPYTDTETGYKFFHKKSVEPFFDKIENDHWFWDTEFMIMVYKHDLSVSEIPVKFVRNEKKPSTVNPMRDSLIYFRELLKYRKKLKG
jgi:glycosyltransferase involved in cell wall biosynthesis